MPKVTEEHLEARTRQIVDGAAACFSTRGFHQTTMQDICKQSALSPGAVYRYFASKEEIIEAMVSERRRAGVALIEAVSREHTNTLARMEEIADLFFSRLEDASGCALDVELWAEAQSNPRVREMMQADADEFAGAFEAMIAAAQERGEINPAVNPRAVAQLMSSMFQGLVLQRSIDPGIEIWPYVEAIKAMMGGRFWTGANNEEGE